MVKVCRLGDTPGEANAFGNIGNVHLTLGQYSEALNYQEQALEIERKIGDTTGEGSTLIDIGDVSYSLGQYTEALNYYKRALEIKRKIGPAPQPLICLGVSRISSTTAGTG